MKDKIRFAVIGSGWRAMFYARIAKAMPDVFELGAMYCRTKEKADKIAGEMGIHTTTSIQECIAYNPEFVVVAVNKASIWEVSKEWLDKGIPVLCETPPSLQLDKLCEIWKMHQNGAKFAVAEQYFKYPSYETLLSKLQTDILGEPYNITLSAIHDYHASSIIRKVLRTNFESVTIYGKKHIFPVTETLTRYEQLYDGKIVGKERVRLTFEYDSGKVAFYDFGGIQYRSTIRSKYINIQGPRGEFVNDTFHYLDDENRLVQEKINTVHGQTFNLENKMSEDEIAISKLMIGMRNYVVTGEELYPLADALQDAYVTILMQEAIDNPNKEIVMQRQIWM